MTEEVPPPKKKPKRPPNYTSPSRQPEYRRADHRSYYARNKDKILAKNERYRQSKMNKLYDYLREHPCVDCGNNDVRVLEFDHVRGEKVWEVSNLVRRNTWAKTMAEIQKCDVRCANCHKIRHDEERRIKKEQAQQEKDLKTRQPELN